MLLPAAAWAEVHGTFTNAKGIVQRVRAAVEPPGEARPHHELIALIAKRLGVDVAAPSPKALFNEMKGAVPEFANASFGRERAAICQAVRKAIMRSKSSSPGAIRSARSRIESVASADPW